MRVSKRSAISALIVSLALVFTGCASTNNSDTSADTPEPDSSNTVRVGVVGASDPYWVDFIDAAAAEGINVELVDFVDYNQPNPALSEGELDLNQFQHIAYLAQHNVASGDDLVPIASTAIYPLAVFSDKHDSTSAIPDGATIAIPNDEANRARALLVLQQAGLLKLDGGGTIFSTPDDIVPEDSRVRVLEVDASFTASSIADVDAAVVNNDFVARSGLKFSDAIFQDDVEDPNALAYVNLFVARSADADNETYRKLTEIFQSNEKIQSGLLETSGGSAVLLQTPAEELNSLLAKVEDDVIANR